MAFDTDPYLTLGLERGATLAEVKQAYRRLAKINHPDAAGEAALPRFLAIQAAYDQIAGPAGRTRPGGAGAGAATPGPRRAWSADPDRTGATYRAYGGRAGRSRAAGGRTGPRPGGGSRRGAGGSAGTAGQSGAGAAGGAGSGTDSGPRRPTRPPNKATLGSTSYDGTEGEPYEPDWGGASWYGTTSGTYWTLNPKEYADPRKHGPEYQSRGRRRRAADDSGAAPIDATGRPGPTARPGSEAPPPQGAAAADPAPPTHTATSWWQATSAGPPAGASRDGERTGRQGRTGTRRPTDDPAATAGHEAGVRARSAARARGEGPRSGPATEGPSVARERPGGQLRSDPPSAGTGPTEASPGAATLASDPYLAAIRGWLDDPRPSPVSRVGRAVLGWVPLALAIGWGAGELSGCARFSADCDPSAAPMTWLIQVLALGLLIAVAPVARIAATAAIATLLAVVPGAILLLATSDPAAIAAGRAALGVLMAAAWIGGLGVGAVREGRRAGRHAAVRPGQRPAEPASGRDGPVS